MILYEIGDVFVSYSTPILGNSNVHRRARKMFGIEQNQSTIKAIIPTSQIYLFKFNYIQLSMKVNKKFDMQTISSHGTNI